MRCKLFVALQCKVLHQFIVRFTSESARRVEEPGAFGATPTRKTLLFNPYQLPTHSGPRRFAPSLSDPMHSAARVVTQSRGRLCKEADEVIHALM